MAVNIKNRFESLKSYVPSLLNSSKEKVSEMFTVMIQTEADFLFKAENTVSDIRELLKSKMEIEVILGLKILIVHMLKDKDISSFHADIINLFLSTNFMIKKLCLNIIENISLKKCEILMLLYNSVCKKVSDTDPLQRWTAIHLIACLKTQSIALECSKHLIPLFNDSNPIIRRLALITLVQYIKTDSTGKNISLSNEEFQSILQKYFQDPHPIVFSTAFYAITEIGNKDYLDLYIPQNFDYYCQNLSKIEQFYFERVVFSLVNFSKLFLLNNFEKNKKHFNTLFIGLYQYVKHSTDNLKIISSLNALYELLMSLENLQLNSISKEELQLFKNGKQLVKLGNILLKCFLCAKNDHEKYLTLDVICSFISKSDMNNRNKNFINTNDCLNTSNNSSGCSIVNTNNHNLSFLEIIRINIEKNFNYFFLKINEREFLSLKKLEILMMLTNESNIKQMLDEFKRNLNFPNISLKKMIIKIIYYISKRNFNINSQSITSLCVEKLIDLLKLKEEGVISQIIICLRKLILEIKDQTKFVLIYNIKNYKKNVTSSIAKANIIWMISQYINVIPTVTVDFFRRLLIDIDMESDDVKSQILGLAMRIHSEITFITNKYNSDVREANITRIKSLIKYAIEKLLWDKNYNIRDKARTVGFLIDNNLVDEKYDFIQNYFEYSGESESSNIKESSDSNKNNFTLSLFAKLSESNQYENLISSKFLFDVIDKNVDLNFYKITLDDLINIKKNETNNSETRNILNSEKYISVNLNKQGTVNETIQNFDSGINVEEMKMKMKNQLDDFLNKDEDDEDEYEVEIRKD